MEIIQPQTTDVSHQIPTKHDEGKVYFTGFNALRFYAALSVVIQHISYSPHDWFGVPLLNKPIERFFINGTDSVNLFFILSGFLITYLLLTERKKNDTVNLRNFYLRRIFRIFPVYFLYLGIVLLVMGVQNYEWELIALLIFFGGNVAFIKYFPMPPFDHLWSIGVEEQYYLAAPMSAKLRRNLIPIFTGIIILWWGLVLLADLEVIPASVGSFLYISRYDLIALGGLLAYAHFHRMAFLGILRHRLVQAAAIGMFIFAAIFVNPTLNPFYTTVAGLAFATLIYNIAVHPRLPILGHPLLEYLGNLSYSIYVYHPFYVLVVYQVLHSQVSTEVYPWIAYPLVVSITILTSMTSYRYWERPFLNFKNRFKRV